MKKIVLSPSSSSIPIGSREIDIFKWTNPEKIEIKFLKSLKPEMDRGLIMAQRFISDDDILAIYEDGHLVLWNIDTSTVKDSISLMAKLKTPTCFDFDPLFNGGIIGGTQNVILSFKISENDKLSVVTSKEIPSDGISDFRIRFWSLDAKIAVGGCWDSTVRIFSWMKPDKLKPLGALKFHQESVQCLDLSRCTYKGLYLMASGGKDGKVAIWNIFN